MGGLRKNSIVFLVSREQLLAEGHIEPTPEEAAEMAAASRRHWEAAKESWALYDAARPLLDAIADPLARAILDLHHSETIESPKCQGCDMDGYDPDWPEWPCRTVAVVAEQYGIDLPRSWDLWCRPEEEFSWSPPKPFVMPELSGFIDVALDEAILVGPDPDRPPTPTEAACWLNADCVRGYHGCLDEDGCQFATTSGDL